MPQDFTVLCKQRFFRPMYAMSDLLTNLNCLLQRIKQTLRQLKSLLSP